MSKTDSIKLHISQNGLKLSSNLRNTDSPTIVTIIRSE